VRTFGGDIGAALSAFAVLFGLSALAFVVAFLLSLWWVDLAIAAVFALVAVGLWQLSMRRTVLTRPIPVRLDGRVTRRRTSSSRRAIRRRRPSDS
jgi:membrane protein implicated in regulation of membrane protease activity